MPAKRKAGLTLLLLCAVMQAQAAEDKGKNENPDQELLEFLGKWESVDGQWVDPGQLQDLSMFQQKDTGEHHEN